MIAAFASGAKAEFWQLASFLPPADTAGLFVEPPVSLMELLNSIRRFLREDVC
jgi:hypothetical protein